MFITTDIREFVKTAFQLRSIVYHMPSLWKVLFIVNLQGFLLSDIYLLATCFIGIFSKSIAYLFVFSGL